MSTSITFIENDVFAPEASPSNPYPVVEGSSITFACTCWGTASSPTAVAYRNRQTVTSTVFPTNTPSASGAVITLSPATGLVGGARYVIAVTFTLSSSTYVRKIELAVGRDEDE